MAQAIIGAAGYLAGLLSALALGLVALAGPLLGLLAVLTWPLRALVEWLTHRSRPAPPAGGSGASPS